MSIKETLTAKSNPEKQQALSEQIEERRKIALSVAEECTRILKQEFQAQEVILFGSLAGDGPWHGDSDLDLAVVGFSDDAWWNAYERLQAIAPAWLKIDLVRLEKVYPEVRDRIIGEKTISSNKYLALKSRIEDEMTGLERSFQGLETALALAETIPEDFVTRTLASYLTDFYKGCERISERVAVTLDGGLPQGENWHQELLRQVADSGGDERPPLWSGSFLLELDEYRKFRHLVMHKYGSELKPERVRELAENAQSVMTKVRQAVAVFSEWLENRAR